MRRRILLAVALLVCASVARAQDPSRPDSIPGKRSDRKKTIAGLIENLKDKDDSVRDRAAEALGSFDPPAVEAVDALIKALEDKAYTVRHRAVESLEAIGTWRAKRAAKRYRKKQARSPAW